MILVIDQPSDRDPLLFEYYTYLKKHVDLHVSYRINDYIENIVKEELDGVKPDVIYQGFTLGDTLGRSAHYINEHNIPVMVEVGDPNLFVTEVRYTKHLWRLETIKYLIARWPKMGKEYKFDVQLRAFQKKGWKVAEITRIRYGAYPETFLKNAKIIHVPWGVNPENYPESETDRPTDVSLICTIASKYEKHQNRVIAKTSLAKIKGITKAIGNAYGMYYFNLLRDSKIFIVCSGSKFLVQKYLEGAMCGCLLLGETPDTNTDCFIDKETIAEVNNYNRIEPPIRYYLEHAEEREAMAKECRKRVINHFNLDKTTRAIRRVLNKLHG